MRLTNPFLLLEISALREWMVLKDLLHLRWGIIGDSVLAAVQNFFSSSKLLKASATFLLSLIPKCPIPSSFNDFRPISLLNFSFKIITKVLARRLSSILPTIISPNQAAFVKGKSIHDHLALAHELTQKLNRKLLGGTLGMKLDISRAFDKLDWSFLFNSLHHFGFSNQWINLVKECVRNSKGSVLLNGETVGFFSTYYGLRQGDPLSPYLFILAEEVLSWNIGKLAEQGAIRPIYSSSSYPPIYHLLFADDILLFMRAISSAAAKLARVLHLHQESSGQVFNINNLW